jgi:hypothetical protein
MPEGPDHYLGSGTGDAANALLGKGFVVAIPQMPLVCWNRDADGKLPSGHSFRMTRRGTAGHDELFSKLGPELKGGTFRLFLEPIVQTINELQSRHPENSGLLMIGLSGGGWSTHLAAAVDPRIDVSRPVAGSLPLYARPFSPGSRGDAEQDYPPLYGEADSDGDGVQDTAAGVCSWLEIYALGAASPRADRPRHVVQVLNLHDSCCFSGTVYKSYAKQLADRVSAIGTGTWRVSVDDSHRDHLISKRTIDHELMPAIEQIPGR